MANKKRAKAKIISGAISAIVCLLSVVAYLIVGLVTKAWHPWWMIVICGAVAAAIIDIITNMVVELNKNAEEQEQNRDETK